MKRHTVTAIIIAVVITLSFTGKLFSREGVSSAGKIASYWEVVKEKTVQCSLCPRRCVITEGQRGYCQSRENIGGSLYSLGYGFPVSARPDWIEKKPFFHVLPGSMTFSVAVAGCIMRCRFCQNWQISQSKPDEAKGYEMSPEDIIKAAKDTGCKTITYTYTEPTVFYEYMLDISKLAKKEGLLTSMHTCGYINREPLVELLDYMDFVNVDLKGFSDDFYGKVGSMAKLQPVLDTIKTVKEKGVWLEITSLIIPTLNDDPQEIRSMCQWIKDNVGDDVPLHFSRFYPQYKLRNLSPTPAKTLLNAYKIAKAAGLKYVYIGNIPGNPQENTYCPKCGKVVVKREGYTVLEVNIEDNKCKFCGFKIAGVWSLKK